MESFIKLIADGGVPAYFIVSMGLISLCLIIERTKVLFFDYSIKSEDFMSQIRGLILKDQVDEAITFCEGNQKSPLARVVKTILQRSDRDEQGIHQGLDIGIAETLPGLSKRLGYLAMLANVATLMGLLGTISGLIMAFSAVSFADPSQKQLVLAQGISMAMNTTALGLSVAIPVMVAYAFLNARQSALLEQITEHGAKVVDLLTSRNYQPFVASVIYPRDLGHSRKDAQPPAAPLERAS